MTVTETGNPEARALEGRAPRISVNEPATYRPNQVDEHGRGYSYFHDLANRRTDADAMNRLARHSREISDWAKTREQRAWRAAEALRERTRGAAEFRVNPNITPGSGGYFTPPAWLIEDAATFTRPRRVLSNLVNQFELPSGVASVHIPVMTAGNTAQTQTPDDAAPSSDVTDSQAQSQVVTIAGIGDVAQQLLDMSPATAGTDHAWFKDLTEAYDYNLEQQLIYGVGGSGAAAQLPGIINVSGIGQVTYTSASPTGAGLFPYFGQLAARVGNNRGLPPSAFLMRTARWGWLTTSEDTADRPLEFPELNGADNPLCPGAISGWPVWVDDSIPQTLTFASSQFTVGSSVNEDTIIACIPQDLYLFEGIPVTTVNDEPLSGTLQVRFVLRNYAAAVTGRYPSGIATLGGTGLAVQSGFSN